MTKATENIIRSACAMDATVERSAVDGAIALLGGTEGTADKPLTPAEVAKMLGRTTRTVARYGDLGVIRRIGGNGIQTRYSRNSVVAFLNGEGRAA